MSCFIPDTSTSRSSTAMNIRKFIKDTELSDHKTNRDSSTLPSAIHQSRTESEELGLIHESREPSFHFINKSLMDQINKPDHTDRNDEFGLSEKKGPVVANNGGTGIPRHDVEANEQDNSGENNNGNNSYQNKLKYLPNADFKCDSNNSYSMNSMNSPASIPNTFKYKSHPNAKTKSKLGVPQDSLQEVEEHSHIVSGRNKDISQTDSNTPPIKTSTIKEKQEHGLNVLNNTDFNATPEWMPEELVEKWIPPKSLELENLENIEPGDFGSSVRITKHSETPKELDLNLQFNSTNTMIHNSNPSANETPMWKRASKEYEFNRKAQPQLHNIFLSIDNLKAESTSIEKSENDTQIQSEKERESESNNNSISSTLSTPMASISNKSGAAYLTKNQIIQLENILEEEGKGKPNDFLLHVPNPESPLKLFGDKYNTFTKGKLTDLLRKINTKTPSSEKLQIRNSEKQKKNYENVIPKTSIPLQEPHLRIKNFTKSGTYTEEQFLQNANNVFNNIQKRGFKMNQDITNDLGNSESRQRSLSSAINSQSTATSTPKNDKVNRLDNLTSEEEYSSFTSRFEENESTEFHQYNNDDRSSAIHQDEYTSFAQSYPSKGEEEMNRPQLSPKNLRTLQREFSNSNDSSYTIDEDASEERHLSEGLYEEENKLKDPRKGQDQGQDQGQGQGQGEGEIAHFASRLEELERLMKNLSLNTYEADIQRLQDENVRLKNELANRNVRNMEHEIGCEVLVDDANFTQEDISQIKNFIKWKRASQLRLQNDNSLNGSPMQRKEQPADQHPIIKGRVEPGIVLPVAYNNMILDTKNQKWIANDKENQYHGSLDSIEDLLIRSDEEDEKEEKTGKKNFNTNSNDNKLTKKIQRRKNDSKLEVSFNLPSLEDETENQEGKFLQFNNVTHISQINDMTFTQTQKKLVAVITEVLSIKENFKTIDWDKVTEIAMTGCQLENIKDLNKFLPKLNKVDLSGNSIKFLDGIPKRIFNLNISDNKIEQITSFSKYHDLQHLNLSFNKMTNLMNVSSNIHLTELVASNAQLTSIDGVRKLENLTKLDISQNDLMGDVNFSNFNLINLQELNISENNIQSLTALERLPNLRILNANENQITQISCIGKHLHLKKLLLKLNNLKRLNLEPYPFLRCIRIDGNTLNVVTDFQKLKHLEELSCKSQNSSNMLTTILSGSKDITKLDLSGNLNLFSTDSGIYALNQIQYRPFLNLNNLILSAMNLLKIPDDFANIFPNIRELNLNFNHLSNISGLSKMQNIKRLYLVSNNIKEIGSVVESLKEIRNTLKVLDLRLNPINISVYPYVFNPDELEHCQNEIVNTANGAPIQLETLDDIESFAIHYHSLTRDHEDWSERDSKFIDQLRSDANLEKAKHRRNYEMLLINFFNRLRKLDGGIITYEKRKSFSKSNLNERAHLSLDA